jgi:hypothetical protein
MKNILLFVAAALIILSCQKQTPIQEEIVTDLGNGNFKYGEVVHTLYGGKTIEVGTVTIGITGSPLDGITDNIYVRYSTEGTDWYIKETHVIVADETSEIPTNKPGNPRIGHFPYSSSHTVGDGTQSVQYPTIPYESGAFLYIATHAVVYNVVTGQEETAFAYNDIDETANRTFSGKRWGWYQTFSWDGTLAPTNELLYFTQYDEFGNLIIYQYNLNTGDLEIISQEEFIEGQGNGVDGAAWDAESNMFVFISKTENGLWASDFDQDEDSYQIGILPADAKDGSLLGNTFYFIDEDNNIWVVTLDDTFQSIVASELIGAIGTDAEVVDIAVSPDGNGLYIVINSEGISELVFYNLNDGVISQVAELGNNPFQIAVDEDGDIHVIEDTEEEDNSTVHDIDKDSGDMDNANDIEIDVEDVTTGPKR